MMIISYYDFDQSLAFNISRKREKKWKFLDQAIQGKKGFKYLNDSKTIVG